jgi:hypothetical protein
VLKEAKTQKRSSMASELTRGMSGTEVPALSFSLIQNSKTKYKINKHFIQLKLQTP